VVRLAVFPVVGPACLCIGGTLDTIAVAADGLLDPASVSTCDMEAAAGGGGGTMRDEGSTSIITPLHPSDTTRLSLSARWSPTTGWSPTDGGGGTTQAR